MAYPIKTISKREEIVSCEKFEISQYQWIKGYEPKTWGYMGYWKKKGILVRMECMEQNPKCTCQEPEGRSCTTWGKRVCDDSAMEVFLACPEKGLRPKKDSMYINFEINPAGVMYASYGRGKKNRTLISALVYENAGPKAWRETEKWGVEVLFPEAFLFEAFGISLKEGTALYCNFYKISEDPTIEHYGTYGKIDGPVPDFHRPDCFVKAVIVA